MVDLVTARSPIPEGRSRSAGRLLAALIAFTLSFAALVAAPQAAHAADVVTVPDANFKAVLNAAIATATATTRTPDEDITPADALTVTTITTGTKVADAPIASLEGIEAFTNLTSIFLWHAESTLTDLQPLGGLVGITSLTLGSTQITSLHGLESLASLSILRLDGNNLLSDISALSGLTLQKIQLDNSPSLTDASPLAGSKNSMVSFQLTKSAVSDINFLEGFKTATGFVLNGNRIEDVSVFSRFDDSYALNDVKTYKLNLSQNRIRDFSPISTFRDIKGLSFGPTTTANTQNVFVGHYDAVNGVTVPLKSEPAFNSNTPVAPTIATAGSGTYDATTGLLMSTDPTAPFLKINPNWTINFSEAPEKLAGLRINEVESNGDAVNGDWLELYNPAATAVDLSGVIVADSDNSHQLVIPTGTTIPAHGYQTIVTENAAGVGPFGLGSADSARLFAPGTTDLATATPLDSFSWTSHATTTYGRTVPGAGIWATTDGGTFGTVNVFPAPTVIPTVAVTGDATSTTGTAALTATVTKPASTDVATDATGTVIFTVDGTDRPGPVTVTNGVAHSTITNLTGSPTGTGHQITARYLAAGDLDPYNDSAVSAPFTVTVTILEFAGGVTLSTTTPENCQPITAIVSGITPTPDNVVYQWQYQAGGAGVWSPYPDASGLTNSITIGFQTSQTEGFTRSGGIYRLNVTASKAGYATRVFTVGPTSQVERAPFLTTPAAVLSNTTPKVGQTITATHAEWTSCIPAEFVYHSGYNYQWLRDGEPIEGATDSSPEDRNVPGTPAGGPKQVSYTVTPADAGHQLSLRVQGSSTQLQNATADSAETSAVAVGSFSASPAPVIDKMSPKLGDTVTASAPVWSPVADLAYQWLRDGAPIVGATSASYTTVVADTEHVLSVRATGTAAGYEAANATSGVTAAVVKGTFAQAPTPVLANTTPVVGDTLTATVPAWAPSADLGWQWLRDGQPIAGATAASYVVTGADLDGVLSVRVSGTAAGYQTETRTSAGTAKVAALQVSRSVGVRYAVTVTAVKGKKVRVGVSTKGVPVSRLAKTAVVKVAGIKGSYTVRLVNGRATLALGKKAKGLKPGKKVKVSVSLTKAATSTTASVAGVVTTTTYTVAKTTKAVKVQLK